MPSHLPVIKEYPKLRQRLAEQYFSRDNTMPSGRHQMAETSIIHMGQPHIQGMNQVEWQPHPTIQGVVTRVFENRASHALADVLIARVAVAGEIPWHVHEAASETAYVLVGEGILKYAQDDRRTDTLEAPLSVGVALTMPPGWWHTVINTGSVSLELFAFHTPPIF